MTATGGPITNETAGTKIVELSRKVRELTAELESEKTKTRQLSKKCQDLQQQVGHTVKVKPLKIGTLEVIKPRHEIT